MNNIFIISLPAWMAKLADKLEIESA